MQKTSALKWIFKPNRIQLKEKIRVTDDLLRELLKEKILVEDNIKDIKVNFYILYGPVVA